MIDSDVFGVEPWSVPEHGLHLELLPQTESLFALSNGHIGLRGNLDEGEPSGIPGTYLNGFYETRPLPYAEAGYGYPEDGQSIINVSNGKVIRLLVDDEPFDVRYGNLHRHERTLDLRAGVLRREVEWTSPAGQAVRVRTTRMVSFVQRAVAAILYEVEPLGAPSRLVVQSELVANEPVPEQTDDPRAAAALRDPLVGEEHRHHELRAGLVHRTRASGLRVAAGMDHLVEGPDGTVTAAETEADLARVTVSAELEPGQVLRVVKLISYGWSSQRSLPALRDQVDAALAGARRTGWEGLCRGQREYLDDVWDRADVVLEGDPALQQAMRFALFHVLQAGARAEARAIPAKGLTGRGYDGHTFWDAETYTLPVLTYVAPQAARDALVWRHSTMDLAAARARELRLKGVAFPWRTIRGQECSGYWPAGTAAYHVNADVADAVRRYVAATGDEDFERGPGLDLLVGTARLWRSVGHHDAVGGFRIDGVTGPDEYTALVDNNVFTNLMAARNLRTAADVAVRHPERAAELGVDHEEVASWRHAADAMVIPYDDDLKVTAQSEGFTRYRQWDFDGTPPDDYPLLLSYPYYLLYTSQVVKQADLVFALYACGDCFEPEQKLRDFDYYERVTVRDSSLSASIQAVVAAEVGHLELAYDYLAETAFIDLRDLAFNTKEGVHLASLAGSWLAAVAGFGGMRDHGETLSFAPRLPTRLDGLRFRMVYRGRRLSVAVDHEQATYELLSGEPLEIVHHGDRLTVGTDARQSRPIPPSAALTAASQPPGREPPRWHREG
ncbi:MAG: GH65 [uncultured Solirubrobacteraceae bacterium]|uniref:GH65 n=1 Tax=uncultured Solirubrobacteraceae bacterium TaxID=1162706 RepID=A0A6J4RB27_9ACTN|nr:MAG: GH65 [uncultured Solirubrobacteraceae bacterium]